MDNENGVVARVPVGFRFRPTDEELIFHYLRRKVFSLPLPTPTPIHELNVFSASPWDFHFPGDLKEKNYFFCKIDKNCENKSGLELEVSAGCGYWKATGDKQVVARATNNVIAIKRSYVFYIRESDKTQWKMRQFRLVVSVRAPGDLTQKLMMPVGDWFVCCLYQKLQDGVQRAKRRKSMISA